MDSEQRQTFEIESFSKIANNLNSRIKYLATANADLPVASDKSIQPLTNGTKISSQFLQVPRPTSTRMARNTSKKYLLNYARNL